MSDITLFPFHETPESVRGLFDAAARADARWAWYGVLADTTLARGERALIATNGEAALPLVLGRRGTMRALTAPYSCRFQPAAAGADAAFALGRGLGRILRSTLRLDALDLEDEATHGLLDGLSQGGLLIERYHHFGNWWEPTPSYAVWRQGRGTRLKETIRRRRAKLERGHRLDLACHSGMAELPSALALYQALHARSWKKAEPDPSFIPALVNRLGAEGSIRLGILAIDEKPAAAQIWLVRDGRATIFKLAQDQAYDAFSPGTLLTAWLLETLIDRDGLREVDFGRGDDPYKRDWLGERRERIGVIACRATSPTGLGVWAATVLPGRVRARAKAILRRPAD